MIRKARKIGSKGSCRIERVLRAMFICPKGNKIGKLFQKPSIILVGGFCENSG